MPTTLILPAALLLDMDGTITEPMLDFPRIKSKLRIGDRPILEAMAEMPPAERIRAEAILEHHEQQAAEQSTLNAGCRELFWWLAEHRIPVALVTRNSPASARTVLARHGLSATVQITREDAPPKPHPRPVLLACERLNVAAPAAWMVGDGAFDIQAGSAAGLTTVWVAHGRTRSFSPAPSHEVRGLCELLDVLRTCALRESADEPSRAVRV